MTVLSEHPTVKWFQERVGAATVEATSPNLDAEWLRKFCLEAGADDVGFVEIGRPGLADQRDDILSFFPQTKTLISIVCRMNREPIRSAARSIAPSLLAPRARCNSTYGGCTPGAGSRRWWVSGAKGST